MHFALNQVGGGCGGSSTQPSPPAPTASRSGHGLGLKNIAEKQQAECTMRSSNVAAIATCALALLVVVTLVSYVPRSSQSMDAAERALLSIRARDGDDEITTIDHHEEQVASKKHMLVSVDAPKPLDAMELRRSHSSVSSLASLGYDASFNRDTSLDFGRMNVQQSTGFTVVASFSFGGRAGNWERIFDFGPFWGASGQGMGVLLAREGGSNTLTSHLYPGGGRGPLVASMPNQIRPNKRMVTVSTYQCTTATVRYVRVQARRSYLQIAYLSVQTADGTNVAANKRAYASGSYPGTNPQSPVRGQPGTRNHPVSAATALPLSACLPADQATRMSLLRRASLFIRISGMHARTLTGGKSTSAPSTPAQRSLNSPFPRSAPCSAFA